MTRLRHALMFAICATALAWQTTALAADSLEARTVKTVDDLIACYQIQPYVVAIQHDGSKTAHFIDETAIVNGCTDKANALALTKPKDSPFLMALAEEIRKGHRNEATLKIYRLVVEHDATKKSCGNPDLYGAMMAGLGQPADYPSRLNSDPKNALAVVEACLGDKQFNEDIKGEIKGDKSYVDQNLCPLLLAHKLIASCK